MAVYGNRAGPRLRGWWASRDVVLLLTLLVSPFGECYNGRQGQYILSRLAVLAAALGKR